MIVPRRFVAVLTRNLLAELLAPTYAASKSLELNEATEVPLDALRNVRAIEPLQRATWAALTEAKPRLGDDAILELVEKKLSKSRRFKPLMAKRSEQAGVAAVLLELDAAAGMATQAAAQILDSVEGQGFTDRGRATVGAHLAAELLR